MKKIIIIMFISICFFISCKESAIVPQKYSIINGKVAAKFTLTKQNGMILGNDILMIDSVKVNLVKNNSIIKSTYTKNGLFSFDNVSSGSYIIQAIVCNEIKKEISIDFIEKEPTAEQTIVFQNEADTTLNMLLFPNPFNDLLEIGYFVRKDGIIANFEIYRATGEKTFSQVFNNLKVGQYTIQFNSWNDRRDIFFIYFNIGEKKGYLIGSNKVIAIE